MATADERRKQARLNDIARCMTAILEAQYALPIFDMKRQLRVHYGYKREEIDEVFALMAQQGEFRAETMTRNKFPVPAPRYR
jgi:hypothetical protein